MEQGHPPPPRRDAPPGLPAQLDFSATPRYQKGGLFTWTVFDYPLKQAIIDGVVKQPMKGITAGLDEARSDVASVKYQGYLTAGVERWREYRDQLKPLGKKPVLFVMLNSTAEADDVGDYLRVKYPAEFGATDDGDAQLLVIHTDRSGEVSKKDLDAAREVARRVDEGESPVNAIVSVLMLREGWDVQNVTVIVGAAPVHVKGEHPPRADDRPRACGSCSATTRRRTSSGWTSSATRRSSSSSSSWRRTRTSRSTPSTSRSRWSSRPSRPIESKLDHDITVPVLSPILARKKTLAEEIAGIDVSKLTCPRLPEEGGRCGRTAVPLRGRRHHHAAEARRARLHDPRAADGGGGHLLLRQAHRPGRQAAIAVRCARPQGARVPAGPGVRRDGRSHRQGDHPGDRDQRRPVRDRQDVRHGSAGLVVEELSPTLEHPGRPLSETEPFPFSRPTFEASKTVFNLVAADNEFERDFAQFLQDATDVTSFAKLPRRFGFAIEYTDSATNLRYYEPDFVAVDRDGRHYVIETKGQENIDVAHKDRAATIWCENATLLTDVTVVVRQGAAGRVRQAAAACPLGRGRRVRIHWRGRHLNDEYTRPPSLEGLVRPAPWSAIAARLTSLVRVSPRGSDM